MRFTERFSRPVAAFSQEIHVVQGALASADRIHRILFEKEEALSLVGHKHSIQGNITFKSVGMSYDNGRSWALRDISFQCEAGQSLGLVGRTGSGKSTTAALLAKLYSYQKGEIKIDGISLKDWDTSYLRSKIGYVSQDVVLFKGNFKENLSCGHLFSDSAIWRACEISGFAEILARSQLSLQSEILEGGINLSAGEKQLLSITRILLSPPQLLIFDEATAQVDPQTEDNLYNALQTIMKQRSCLMIAHRLKTIENCDQILVFSNGRIVEQGTHSILVHKENSYYSQLHQATAI